MADPVLTHIEHGTEDWDGTIDDNMDKIDANFVRSTKSSDHGAKTYFEHVEVPSGVLAGPSVTLAGAIPAGAKVQGVTTRVKVAIPGPTTDFDVGDGVTVNLFASAAPTAANGTTDLLDHKATWADTFYKVANDIVLTANGGDFGGGEVLVVVHYVTLRAPTSA